MRVGIFADTHDHLDNIRRCVEIFNAAKCECVLFAGDLVSTFAVPPLRKLKCRMIACFGDNEGNKIGLRSGFTIVGEIGEAPYQYTAADGTRFVLVHMERQLRGFENDFDVAVYGHTHKPRISQDEQGRLFLNPGEASGWTFGRPTVILFDTVTREAQIVEITSAVPTTPLPDTHNSELDSSPTMHSKIGS